MEFDRDVGRDHRELHRRQAEALSRVAASDALEELVAIGLLPAAVARRAVQTVAVEVGDKPAG
ncbi:MAG: hypothetical protein M3Q65_01565 [Chloroflexota bacterium]|nr:hypothetical protein [Chloroflexota bacterium]